MSILCDQHASCMYVVTGNATIQQLLAHTTIAMSILWKGMTPQAHTSAQSADGLLSPGAAGGRGRPACQPAVLAEGHVPAGVLVPAAVLAAGWAAPATNILLQYLNFSRRVLSNNTTLFHPSLMCSPLCCCSFQFHDAKPVLFAWRHNPGATYDASLGTACFTMLCSRFEAAPNWSSAASIW